LCLSQSTKCCSYIAHIWDWTELSSLSSLYNVSLVMAIEKKRWSNLLFWPCKRIKPSKKLRYTEANDNAYWGPEWYTSVFPSWWMENRDRIFKRLRSPGIDSKESSPQAKKVAWNRFLGLLKRFQIWAQNPTQTFQPNPPTCCTFYNTVHNFFLWMHPIIQHRRSSVLKVYFYDWSFSSKM
jgi:hypothetical protein